MEYSRLRFTQSSWNDCNCYSQVGIALTYFNFNNPEELGSSWSAYLYAQPYLTYGKIQLHMRAGIGLSYLTKVYDEVDNPRDLFFSSPVGVLLVAALVTRRQIAEQWTIVLSANYQHISNGGIQQPNKGMNFPTLGLGSEYILNPVDLRRRPRTVRKDRFVQTYASLFITTRSVDVPGSISQVRKPLVGLQTGFYKPVSYLSAVGIATEAYYDGSLIDQSGESPWVVSGLIKHHLLFGRFDFNQAFGVYLFKDYANDHTIFQRYAIEYRINPVLAVGFSLKAHLNVAEQMDPRVKFLF